MSRCKRCSAWAHKCRCTPEELGATPAVQRILFEPNSDELRLRSRVAELEAENLVLRARPLEVRHGDTLVVEFEGKLSNDDCARIRDRFTSFVVERGWKDVKILVIDGGIRLNVMRRVHEDGDD